MTASPPTPEIQRALLKTQIENHKQEYWLLTTLAKSYKKAGLMDAAKKNAEGAASMERAVDALEEELKAVK